jgi:hypothetical protein
VYEMDRGEVRVFSFRLPPAELRFIRARLPMRLDVHAVAFDSAPEEGRRSSSYGPKRPSRERRQLAVDRRSAACDRSRVSWSGSICTR